MERVFIRTRSVRSPRPLHLDEVHTGFQLRFNQEIAVYVASVVFGNYFTLLRDQLALRIARTRRLHAQPSHLGQRNPEVVDVVSVGQHGESGGVDHHLSGGIGRVAIFGAARAKGDDSRIGQVEGMHSVRRAVRPFGVVRFRHTQGGAVSIWIAPVGRREVRHLKAL